MNDPRPSRLASTKDVVVVGGGQAGLAAAASIEARGVPVTVFDAAPAVGDVWRGRWDSLRLFTPARYSSLPGLPFPGDPDRYPGKAEVADYLRTYAATFDLDVRNSVRVERVAIADEGFEVVTSEGTAHAHDVVVATGPFQSPAVPEVAADVGSGVSQLHSSEYRRSGDLPDGPILVVGGGNSGLQVAEDLASTHQVELAVGARARSIPQRIAGRDLFWWLTRTGLLTIGADSKLGRRLRERELLIGSSVRRLQRRGVTLRSRAIGADHETVRFADGTATQVAAIVWATGYRRHHGIVDIPGALDDDGVLVQNGVRTEVPGLYALGQPWQRDRGSALLGFVGREAAEIADLVTSRGRISRSTTPLGSPRR